MTLKKIIVVCHGFYSGGRLASEGRRQIEDLAKALVPRVAGCRIALLSSATARALETAKILATTLGGMKVEEEGCLCSHGSGMSEESAREAIRLVEEKGKEYEVVILSTHLEFAQYFPFFWGKTRGFRIPVDTDVPDGTARIIETVRGTVLKLQPVRPQIVSAFQSAP
jgi:hypothetical protein